MKLIEGFKGELEIYKGVVMDTYDHRGRHVQIEGYGFTIKTNLQEIVENMIFDRITAEELKEMGYYEGFHSINEYDLDSICEYLGIDEVDFKGLTNQDE